jgi:hypothetical protein
LTHTDQRHRWPRGTVAPAVTAFEQADCGDDLTASAPRLSPARPSQGSTSHRMSSCWRSACLPPPRPNWTATPPSGSPATAGSTQLPWLAACPAWPPSAGPPWPPPWGRPAGSPTRPSSVPSLALRQGVGDRPDRPQRPADQQGRQPAAADHPGPRRRQRPPRRSPAGPPLPHPDGPARQDHLGAVCVVAAHLAERAWAVMDRDMPYVICDTDGTPVTAEQAKAIITERYSAAAAGAAGRGRPLSKSSKDMSKALKARRGDPPLRPPVLAGGPPRQAGPATHLTPKPP